MNIAAGVFKAECLKLMDTVHKTHEEIIISKRGKPVARLLSAEDAPSVEIFGMLAGTATPTPGGLVGAEAGLFTGFTAYGVSVLDAGAAVLLFRLVTYWLPLFPGLLALLAGRKNGLI